MKICKSQVANKFFNYNLAYFNGILPEPSFILIDSFKYFGMFECRFCNGKVIDPIIKISENYDYTNEQLRNIIVHEMLHYYLAYTGMDRKVHHGKEFMAESARLNKQFRLNITTTINMEGYTRCPGTSSIRFFLAKLF